MVRGEGKRCREILPLTSIAHSVILSAFSLYFCGWERGREGGEHGGCLGVFAGWQQQPVRTEPTSQPPCIFQSPHAILLLSLLPLSVAALTNFPPHCHSYAICLFGQPSSYWDHLSRTTSCPRVTECISWYLLYNPRRLGDSFYHKCGRTSLQTQGFYSSLRCNTGTIKPFKQSYNCTIAFVALPQ